MMYPDDLDWDSDVDEGQKDLSRWQNLGENLPQDIDITEEAVSATTRLNSLPRKSREKYEKEYDIFKNWLKERDIQEVTEDVVYTYFMLMSHEYKSPTLWSKYSMLKATMTIKENVDMKYPKVLAFLKRLGVGYKSKTAKVFSRDEINRFLSEASDEYYLLMKVVLIIGVAGGCRVGELVNLTVDDVQDRGDILIIKIPDSITKIQRVFIVTNETIIPGVNILEIYRKYVALRRKVTMASTRLFVNYTKGKCVAQVVGKNTVAHMPGKIAKYLQLPHSEDYMGHSFRRTSSVLIETRGDVPTFKKHTRPSSAPMGRTPEPEEFLEDSISDPIKEEYQVPSPVEFGDELVDPLSVNTVENCQNGNSPEADVTTTHKNVENSTIDCSSTMSKGNINFSNLNNCTININIGVNKY